MNALKETLPDLPAPPILNPWVKGEVDQLRAAGFKNKQILSVVSLAMGKKFPASVEVIRASLETVEARR